MSSDNSSSDQSNDFEMETEPKIQKGLDDISSEDSKDDDGASESVEEVGNDIVIQANQMNDFFFMDSDQEEQKYGVSTNSSKALSGNILKDTKQ